MGLGPGRALLPSWRRRGQTCLGGDRGQGRRMGVRWGKRGGGGGQCVCVCVCVSTHDKEGLKIRGWEEWRCESKEQKWTKREGM